MKLVHIRIAVLCKVRITKDVGLSERTHTP